MENNFGVWNTKPSELHIIGDIHGDFFALKQSLELTNCVKFEDYKHKLIYNEGTETYYLEDGCSIYQKKEISWNPEKTNCFIIFSGDIIDRCRPTNNSCINTINDENCDYLILKLLFNLDKKALKYGSRVILVLGNHEIMNLKNMDGYVSNKGKNDGNRNKNIKKLLMENINNIYGMVRVENNIIVHGGINDEYIDKFKKIFKIYNEEYEYIYLFNKYLQMYLKILLVDSTFDYKVKYMMENKTKNDNYETYKIFCKLFIINVKISPFWDRTLGGLVELNEDQCKNIFDNNVLNIKSDISQLKIIVGHCPQFMSNTNINLEDCQNYKDKIYRIDVGMSRAFDSYAKYDVLNDFLDSININKCKHLDFNMFYDPYFHNFRQVGVLQILSNSQPYNKIKGITSIEYFNGYFKDCKDLLLYTLSDIYMIYTKIPDPKDIKTKIQKILKSKNNFSFIGLINNFINLFRN